jgi:hypothetical protein
MISVFAAEVNRLQAESKLAATCSSSAKNKKGSDFTEPFSCD